MNKTFHIEIIWQLCKHRFMWLEKGQSFTWNDTRYIIVRFVGEYVEVVVAEFE